LDLRKRSAGVAPGHLVGETIAIIRLVGDYGDIVERVHQLRSGAMLVDFEVGGIHGAQLAAGSLS